MKIDVLCNDGSPLGVTCKDIWGLGKRGVGIGGSELALLTMCEAWTEAGHKVTLYNDPVEKNQSPFEQRRISAFIPSGKRDILINFRSPNPLSFNARGKKIWWSCDQYSVGNYAEYATKVDRIVCISPYHQWYFEMTYGITGTTYIDIPVRIQDFFNIQDANIHNNQLIFNSVPDRGLQYLFDIYPKLIRELPSISLVITSDYRLWGVPSAGNQQYISKFYGMKNVRFVGAVSRGEYLRHLLESDAQAYPCSYDELFCISCAEAQVAGAYPITPDIAALSTTNMGKLVPGRPTDPFWMGQYADAVLEFLTSPKKEELRDRTMQRAVNRFSLITILEKWERVFNE